MSEHCQQGYQLPTVFLIDFPFSFFQASLFVIKLIEGDEFDQPFCTVVQVSYLQIYLLCFKERKKYRFGKT